MSSQFDDPSDPRRPFTFTDAFADHAREAWDRAAAKVDFPAADPNIACLPMERAPNGMPYYWDGSDFVDGKGLLVNAPLEMRNAMLLKRAEALAAPFRDANPSLSYEAYISRCSLDITLKVSHRNRSADLLHELGFRLTHDGAKEKGVDATINRSWTELTAAVLHDIRNPTAVRGNTRQLAQANATDTDRQADASAPCVGTSFDSILADNHRWVKQREQYRQIMEKSSGPIGSGGLQDLVPPMPQSAIHQQIADRISERIIALINSKPQSPRKDEIAEVVATELTLAGQTAFAVMARDADLLHSAPTFGADFGSGDRTAMGQVGRGGGPWAFIFSHHCADTKGDPNPRCDACGERASIWDQVKCRAVREETEKRHAAILNAPFDAGATSGGSALSARSENAGLGINAPGYRNKDNQVIAFAPFTQYDGPKALYYEARDGEMLHRYQYQTFAWRSADPAKIVARLAHFAEDMKDRGVHTLVWRSRPELIQMVNGEYKFYCRLHVLPYMRLAGEKLQGEETPQA